MTIHPQTVNIQLQVLGESLRAVAEEMGAVLIRSAFSANVKERRDCSTAPTSAWSARETAKPSAVRETIVTSGRCVPPA